MSIYTEKQKKQSELSLFFEEKLRISSFMTMEENNEGQFEVIECAIIRILDFMPVFTIPRIRVMVSPIALLNFSDKKVAEIAMCKLAELNTSQVIYPRTSAVISFPRLRYPGILDLPPYRAYEINKGNKTSFLGNIASIEDARAYARRNDKKYDDKEYLRLNYNNKFQERDNIDFLKTLTKISSQAEKAAAE